MTVICTKCQENNLPGSRFCAGCGYDLKLAKKIEEQRQKYRPTPSPIPQPFWPDGAPSGWSPPNSPQPQGGPPAPTAYASLTDTRNEKKFFLYYDRTTLGRSPSELVQHIDLSQLEQSQSISRQHLEILRDLAQPGQALAMDLGSSNGTFIDQGKLAPNSHYPLKSGSILKLGQCEFVYQSISK